MRYLAIFLLLAACSADLPGPDGVISEQSRNQPYPRLLPLTPLLAEEGIPSRAAQAQDELAERVARGENRAVPSPGTDDLAERARRLRERAAELNAR